MYYQDDVPKICVRVVGNIFTVKYLLVLGNENQIIILLICSLKFPL